jgi:peptidoglycan L-alanyl-D-glutamate endopeptidase CwlK
MSALINAPEELRPYIARGASPELALMMAAWHHLLEQEQAPVLVYTVFRSPAAQALLYAQGRTKPGHIVTNAKPGQSAHNRQVNGQPAADAFDACPLILNKPSWETTGEALHIWNVMGSLAEKVGLEWGRHYKSLGGDWAHFELPRERLHLGGKAA